MVPVSEYDVERLATLDRLDHRRKRVAADLQDAGSDEVWIQVEVRGPAGSRKTSTVQLPKELANLNTHQCIVDLLVYATASYERLAALALHAFFDRQCVKWFRRYFKRGPMPHHLVWWFRLCSWCEFCLRVRRP